jgi:hypothetical protein
MTPEEWDLQRAAEIVEPFGEDREDMRMAFTVTYLATAFGAKDVKPSEVLKDFRKWIGMEEAETHSKPQERLSPEATAHVLDSLFGKRQQVEA